MGFINKHLRRHDFVTGKPGHLIICGTAGEFIGFKSQTYLEPGYVWAPYIPIDLETEFQPRQGTASRVYNGVQLPRVKRMFV